MDGVARDSMQENLIGPSWWHAHVTTPKTANSATSNTAINAQRTLLSSLTTMQLDRQPRSGLSTVKRDFSSNHTPSTSSAFVPVPAPTKRSTLSDSLRKAIQDGVASREAEKASLTSPSPTVSQKRSLSPGAAPPRRKRQLPSSWGELEPSSATQPHESSRSSAFLRPHSSMRSDMPPDMLSQSHQEASESPFSQPKPARRPATISLSDEQKAILELVMQKKNVFYTGSAGMSSCLVLIHRLPMRTLLSFASRVESQAIVRGDWFRASPFQLIIPCAPSSRKADTHTRNGQICSSTRDYQSPSQEICENA